MLTNDQKKMLEAPLSRDAVKTREQGGRKVSFVEGWHVIAEANRILGFDGWSSETTEVRCVAERERLIGQKADPGWGVTYVARVQIIAGGVVRHGYGAGHGIDRDLGQAHESAIKEAETDAMKRAMRMFGNTFGLALYDKSQANVADAPDESEVSRLRFIDACIETIDRIGKHPDPKDLLNWWNSDIEKKKRRDFDLNKDEVERLKLLIVSRVNEGIRK